jgi:hypothetical protein
MHRYHRRSVRPADAKLGVLVGVVAEHHRSDLVGHLDQQRAALPGAQHTIRDQPIQQNLAGDLVVGAVHPSRVVDSIDIEPATGPGELDPTALGQTEGTAFRHRPHPQLCAVHPNHVIGLVGDVGVGLCGGLDVGADPTCEQQLRRAGQDRSDEFRRGQLGASARRPESAWRRGATPHRRC